jgi:hypothetical protein
MTDDTPTGLSATQMTILTVMGAGFWFAGAMILRLAEPLGAYQGAGRLLLYAAILIGTVPFVPLVRIVAKLREDQMALGAAWATGAAMVCDSLALPFIPQLYGTDTAGAGAAILWGAAAAIFLGFAFNRRAIS